MRELNGHKVNPANDVLTVRVIDEPGSGGAHHAYLISGFDNTKNPSDPDDQDPDTCLVLFQNGPINDVGVNGVTHEALLAILCDRLRGFQAGPYASADNAEALACMEQAQAALQRRTKARMARGAATKGTMMEWPEWTPDTMFYCDYTRAHAGAPGHNAYGVPLHACNGYKHDAHIWAYYSTIGTSR